MYLEAKLQLQQTPYCFHGSNLRAVWVRDDITSCFAQSFPLPHLLFPHLLNQTSFSCVGHLLTKLNILQFYRTSFTCVGHLLVLSDTFSFNDHVCLLIYCAQQWTYANSIFCPQKAFINNHGNIFLSIAFIVSENRPPPKNVPSGVTKVLILGQLQQCVSLRLFK